MMRRTVGCLTVMFVLAWGSLARSAPPPEAEADAARLSGEAESSFSSGDFKQAAEKFERAYRIAPGAAVLWKAAQSWQRAGDDVRSANLLERLLREAPAYAKERERATATLTDLKKRLGTFEIHGIGVEDIRVDGAPADVAIVYVAPGEHVATATAGATVVRMVATVAAGESRSIVLAPPERAPNEGRPTPSEPSSAPTQGRSGLSPVIVVVGAGLTAVGAGIGVLTALQWGSQAETFDGLSRDPSSTRQQQQEALDDLRDIGIRRNWILGTTAGLALGTSVLAIFFVDWKKKPDKPDGTRRLSSPWWTVDVAVSGASFKGTW
jgi:hypothetical protein